jgi:3'-phosphoadenosine 5'-phosphosulfate sulfotransferase (PAPS reductase)/FAD synthetase
MIYNDHQARIKNRIKESIKKFKNKEIDYNGFVGNISGNINALENLTKAIENAKYRVCGELEIIHFTVDTDKEFEEMLKEVEKFEKFIDENL